MASNSFSVDISKWVNKTKVKSDVIIRKIALDLFTKVILRSPVDTGRFRGNWQVAIGSMPDGTLEIDDKTGTATVNKATAKVAGVKAGDTIFLINNLPYGPALEYGHSRQAPTGMVRVTIREFQAIVSKAAKA